MHVYYINFINVCYCLRFDYSPALNICTIQSDAFRPNSIPNFVDYGNWEKFSSPTKICTFRLNVVVDIPRKVTMLNKVHSE